MARASPKTERRAGAHGWFEAYGKIGDEPASKYTRARVQIGRAHV